MTEEKMINPKVKPVSGDNAPKTHVKPTETKVKGVEQADNPDPTASFITQVPLSQAAKEIKHDLINNLQFLSHTTNNSLMEKEFFLPLERTLSEHRDLYFKDDLRKQIASNAIQKTTGKVTQTTDGEDLGSAIIKRYIFNPFGIFDFILTLRASDIFIVRDKISFTATNDEKATEIKIPTELLPTWYKFVDRFITLTLYASDIPKTKFDRVNAILDYETETVRFNVVYEALSAVRDGRPIISLRNQLLDFNKSNSKEGAAFNDRYIKEQNLSKEQLDFIHDIALNNSFLIYGETGSGKSTLLKYMGNYKPEERRNLITIEDTPELFLPVNIAYLTNDKFSIRDLFKVSLRENPSHIFIGETRSEEIIDILESGLVFNCGTTLHANSFEKVIMRIVFLIKSAGASYSTDDIFQLITTVMGGFIWMQNRKIKEV